MMKDLMSKKKRVFCYIILWCLSVFQYNMILSYSSEPAKQSAIESRAVSNKISNTLEFVLGTEIHVSQKGKIISFHSIIRKVAHVTVFFLFAFLNIMLFYIASVGNCYKSLCSTLFIGLCGAMFDECLQLFIVGRAGRFSDVLVDSVGTCGACFLFFLLLYKFRLREERVIV